MPESSDKPKVESLDEHRRAKNSPADAGLATIEEAIDEYRRGRFVIIVDDEGRENEGDLTIPAEFITDEAVTFMIKHTSGIICVPLSEERLDNLRIPLMVGNNQAQYGTAFTISVDARFGITTGVSAHDRAETIRVLSSPTSAPSDLVMPGHMYPLRARDGGSCTRWAHRGDGGPLQDGRPTPGGRSL
jgi:3,4-dihydroxy 2-butanone 4-phosphate synthase/GTP cyclohydrolase II